MSNRKRGLTGRSDSVSALPVSASLSSNTSLTTTRFSTNRRMLSDLVFFAVCGNPIPDRLKQVDLEILSKPSGRSTLILKFSGRLNVDLFTGGRKGAVGGEGS